MAAPNDHYVLRYTRQTYKKNRKDEEESPTEEFNYNVVDGSRSNKVENCVAETSCSCDVDSDGDVASILHKKCPVITLARRQLHKLHTETDRLLCQSQNTRCCRSFFDVLCIGKDLLLSNSKYKYAYLMLLVLAFFCGLLIGAASCGTRFGRFNSPILTCIDNYFILDTYPKLGNSLRCIV